MCGGRAQQYEGWKKALAKYLPFNLAAFLIVAETNTWFTQAVWCESTQPHARSGSGSGCGCGSFSYPGSGLGF